MKVLTIAASLFLVASPAFAVQPVNFGSEWVWGATADIATDCTADASPQPACVVFPAGARVQAIFGTLAVKVPGEVLFQLRLDRPGDSWITVGSFHIPVAGTIPVSIVYYPGDPLVVPPGGRIWVYVVGYPLSATSHPAPIEAQLTFNVEDGTPYAFVISDAEAYWRRNPDVAASTLYGRTNRHGAWQHYSRYGQYEGRWWGQ